MVPDRVSYHWASLAEVVEGSRRVVGEALRQEGEEPMYSEGVVERDDLEEGEVALGPSSIASSPHDRSLVWP